MSKKDIPNKPPYQPWQEDGFWTPRVRCLAPMARLMYRALLAQAWISKPACQISNDKATLMRLSDCPDERTWRRHGPAVLAMFELSEDGNTYSNDRQVKEYSLWQSKHKSYSTRGRTAANSRLKVLKSQDEDFSQLPASSPTAQAQLNGSSSSAQLQLAGSTSSAQLQLESSTTLAETEAKPDQPPAEKKRKPRAPSETGNPANLSKALAQTKHQRIVDLIFSAYKQNNDGIKPPFDDTDALQVRLLLKATPDWQDQLYAQCLGNLYLSDGFPAGTRPREFLPRLPRYLKGPLDQYKNDVRSTNGRQQRERRTRQDDADTDRAADAALEKVFGRKDEVGGAQVSAGASAKFGDPS